MYKNKTPVKLANKKVNKEKDQSTSTSYTKEDLETLLKEVEMLKQEDNELNKELEEMNKKGVKVTDSVLIMNALHEFNETRDALINVFDFLSNVTGCTSAELHRKYDVPLE